MKMWSKTANQQALSSRPSNIYNRILSMALVLVLVLSTFGGIASAADETVNSVHIDSDTPSGKLYVEDNSIILTATASISGGSGASTRNVTDEATWTSTSSSVKVVKGVVTASGAVSSAIITARYKDQTDTFLVSAEYYYNNINLLRNSSNVPEKMDVYLGDNLTFTATGSKSDTSVDTITDTAQWTSSNTNIATVSKGVVKLLSAGEATITVKSKGKSNSTILTVKSPFDKIEIRDAALEELKSRPIELNVGDGSLQLKAKAIYKSGASGNDNVTDDATWTSSNVSVVKVSDKGELTIVGLGTAVITAKHYGATDSVTVIVRTEYEALKVTPEKGINVPLFGSRVELTATASSGRDPNNSVTNLAEWKISDEDQAVAVIKKENNKVYAVPRGIGTARITVTYMGLTKTITVTVSPTITTVDIEKDKLDVFVNDSAALPAVKGKTVAGDSKDIAKFVEWTSSNNNIVSIEDGKFKALTPGTAILTASMESVAGMPFIADTIIVNVNKKILALIPSEDTISVVIGREADFPRVDLINEDGTEDTITSKIVWKSSTPKLLVTPAKLKGLLASSATLTGTYMNQTVKIKVTVEEEFTSFAIEPKQISTTLNKSQSIKVVGTTKSGKKVNIGSRIDWHPSSEDHVTVKGASVRGLAEGSGKLTATVQGKSLEIPYIVTAKLTKLTSSNTSFTSVVGDQLSVELTALYENGKSFDATSSAVWSSSTTSVATVANGKISVKGKGTAVIKAVFGDKSVSIRVTAK
ncbi:hypothetical protein [Cohnella mopanensis]|uniref:hypothetical protein n=1 Tax=Cohnella mopanensis TaxID=2911966 RepID=UPI001EF86254|nr:hypothetical protein [Cohnella mopanensis]